MFLKAVAETLLSTILETPAKHEKSSYQHSCGLNATRSSIGSRSPRRVSSMMQRRNPRDSMRLPSPVVSDRQRLVVSLLVRLLDRLTHD